MTQVQSSAQSQLQQTSSPASIVTIFRVVFFSAGLLALNSNIGADLLAPLICLTALVGAFLGKQAAEISFGSFGGGKPPLSSSRSVLSLRGVLSLVAIAVLTWFTLRYLGDQITPSSSITSDGTAFSWYVFSRKLELYFGIALVIAVFEWLYRRTNSWLTVEAFLIAATSIYALMQHRQFRLDSPRAVAELAWGWNYNPIAVFVGVGAVLSCVVIVFIGVCAKPKGKISAPMKRRAMLSASAALISVVLLCAFVAFYATSIVVGSRLMNGVGQNNETGISPLSFQSALGATNQPAAVVRLEGDYKDNPSTPMLYLREDALSEYNGTELVHAGAAYDSDVIASGPDQTFKADEDASLRERVPLPQSVYLLAEHKIPFAVDFPIALNPLKNPNPAKFKGGAYRVYSQAPIYKLEGLKNESVGNPAWDEIERQHYLKTSADARYEKLAVSITSASAIGDGSDNAVVRAFALSEYLAEKSIYTLAPNHEITPGSTDLTAPYLFGDMRGYCVHFAHAMVYMLRSIGIPARIGTGYLTDLSQSKDGHILLRMSDRHAWAEVYVTNKGWVPFDVQPHQVESHGDSEVDQKLLEDLMSQLDPGEEILPKDPKKPEPGLTANDETPWSAYLPRRMVVVLSLVAAFLGLILFKLFLKHLAWRLPFSHALRLKLKFRAQVLNAAELGLKRDSSETWTEFERRADTYLGANPVSLTTELNTLRYGDYKAGTQVPHSQTMRFIAPKTALKKAWYFLSPSGIRRYFSP